MVISQAISKLSGPVAAAVIAGQALAGIDTTAQRGTPQPESGVCTHDPLLLLRMLASTADTAAHAGSVYMFKPIFVCLWGSIIIRSRENGLVLSLLNAP